MRPRVGRFRFEGEGQDMDQLQYLSKTLSVGDMTVCIQGMSVRSAQP